MATVDGFARRAISRGELWLADGFEHAVDELGLDQLSRWEERLSSGVPAGRGNVAFVETAQGPLVLKQLRRGGVAGRGAIAAAMSVLTAHAPLRSGAPQPGSHE